jgi:hypothetical protein
MGLFTTVIAYKLGKRSGKRDSETVVVHDSRDPECLNYERYCRYKGSCDGQECDYGSNPC